MIQHYAYTSRVARYVSQETFVKIFYIFYIQESSNANLALKDCFLIK